ncbi:MAG: PilZ domain-containing protein [Deltaproteobacteria bacterium]|nr:PilZ domain-containing protein [Deltaproteobacteria bacterium]
MDKRKNRQKDKEQRIISLDDYRRNKTEEKRRQYERVLFNRILGVYSFVEKNGLQHIEVMDISRSGLKFREQMPEHPLPVGQKMALRFYFTPSSYLRVIIEVKRANRFSDDERTGFEYGCALDTNTRSYEAIKTLISFMYKYSEIACKDQSPPMIWF